MKTYVTTLLSNKERYNYITHHLKILGLDYVEIEAIDKNNLADDEIKRICNVDDFNKLESWLTKGNIACVLSKTKAYEAFLKTKMDVGFFIEDDVILPINIQDILNDLLNEISINEVILLDFRTVNTSYKIGISTIHSKKLKDGLLSFPIQLKGLTGGAAYLLTRNVAENLISLNKNVLHTAPDSWDYFYTKNAFEKIRVLYPSPVRFKPFKSAIGYTSEKNILNKIINYAEQKQVFPIYQLMQKKRKLFHRSVQQSFFLINEKSFIDQIKE